MSTLSEIIDYTNDFLRIDEIEDWPNALNGLQIENSGRVTKIGAAVDVSTRVLTAAAKKDVDLLATQHGEQIYRHDLILLGLGDDGHTASLFPESAALNETNQRVVANFVSKLNSWRLTFTFPLINHARHVCFLVNANKQGKLVDYVVNGDPQFPASRVNPSAGALTWILGE